MNAHVTVTHDQSPHDVNSHVTASGGQSTTVVYHHVTVRPDQSPHDVSRHATATLHQSARRGATTPIDDVIVCDLAARQQLDGGSGSDDRFHIRPISPITADSTTASNNTPMEIENPSDIHSSQVGFDIVQYCLIILTMALIIVSIASYDSDLMKFIYATLFDVTLAFGSALTLHVLRCYATTWARVYTHSPDVAMNPGIFVTIACTSGVYLYCFFFSLPHVISFMMPDIGQQIERLIRVNATCGRPYFDHLLFVRVTESAGALIEIVFTASMTMIITMIHHDMNDRFLAKASPRSTEVILLMAIVGHIGFWLFKSVLSVSYSSTKPVQMAFYGERTWSIIIHVVNPLAVYYHFHVVLILIEYVLII